MSAVQIINLLLTVLGGYGLLGLIFAVPFVLFGAKRIDPTARQGSWGFRVLILPGCIVFWPLLLRRWRSGTAEPPSECSPHRQAAGCPCKGEGPS